MTVAQEWRRRPISIPTRWSAEINHAHVWPEYPRPQLVRPHWQNLNGLWEYAITARDAPPPRLYTGCILVPFPLESALSGVQRSLDPEQLLWYRRQFTLEPGPSGERVLLHFGAVDWQTTVYLNGRTLGIHSGGYQCFTFEITEALRAGDNELVVSVFDPTDKGPNPRGKQALRPEWAFYTANSGIWQTVWLERVPATYIESLKLTPDVDRSELRVEVNLQGQVEGCTLQAIASSASKAVANQTFERSTALSIDSPRLWSPDDPHLYDLEVRLLNQGRVVDAVESYFGMRKIEVKADPQGKPRIYLNNRCIYHLGVADQGYWPDGLYTAPTDEALQFDIRAIKALGFNTVRKHLKVEPQRWYTHCDRLGLLVWQDMPSSNNDSLEGRSQFEEEIEANIAQLHNHPSLVAWALFNEGWGAYDQERLARSIKQADPTRLLNGHSGPLDQLESAQFFKRLKPVQLPGPLGGDTTGLSLEELQRVQHTAKWVAGDMVDIHFYPGPEMPPMQDGAAPVLGEHGSFGVFIEGHVEDELRPIGKGLGASGMTPQQFLKAYADSIEALKTLEAQGLSGSCYFEMFDVETEQHGFITYDREIAKLPVAQVARLNAQLVPKAGNYEEATRGFSIKDAAETTESARYAILAAEYQKGRRDPDFLKRLALTALRQGDERQMVEAARAYIAQASRPYSKETWAVIAATTRASSHPGYALLCAQSEAANAMLGTQAAQKKLLEVIQREAIEPYFQDRSRTPDWIALERVVADQYGELGREAVIGARMMYALVKADWENFATGYTQYYERATERSLYPINSVTYRVLEHVNDPRALETAVQVMRWRLHCDREEFPVFGRYDPSALDTYANLLYKIGRKAEALEWQQKAFELSGGRDREIREHFEKMKTGGDQAGHSPGHII